MCLRIQIKKKSKENTKTPQTLKIWYTDPLTYTFQSFIFTLLLIYIPSCSPLWLSVEG